MLAKRPVFEEHEGWAGTPHDWTFVARTAVAERFPHLQKALSFEIRLNASAPVIRKCQSHHPGSWQMPAPLKIADTAQAPFSDDRQGTTPPEAVSFDLEAGMFAVQSLAAIMSALFLDGGKLRDVLSRSKLNPSAG